MSGCIDSIGPIVKVRQVSGSKADLPLVIISEDQVFDGDTILDANLTVIDKDGRFCSGPVNLRINGIDAPESGKTPKKYGPSCYNILKEEGRLVKARLIELLKQPDGILKFRYDFLGYDSRGRVLADIYTLDGINIAKELIKSTPALPYDGQKAREQDYWCK